MCVTTRGASPRVNPRQPSRRAMIRSASAIPRAPRISASVLDPRVCSSVFATSSGVVSAAATAPAVPPHTACASGEYAPLGLSAFFACSYTVNCAAVNGTLIVSVVGYET
jgi:hypothetical protein